jgi:tetratricopeptide (TPR) repeat protein
MKKKSSAFILVLIAFLVFSNTGYAKSVSKKITAVFGSYVVKVNGKTQSTETLANGSKVYVSITDLTKLTGAAVKKTGTTYAITPVVKEDGVTKKHVDALKKELEEAKEELEVAKQEFEEAMDNLQDTEKIQAELDDITLMVQFMDTYKNLEDFTNYLYFLSESLDYSYYSIREGDDRPLGDTEESYEHLIEGLDAISDDFDAIIAAAKSQGFDYAEDVNIVGEIISENEKALELFNESIELLGKYAETSQESYADESYELASDALDISFEVQESAADEYDYYLSEITGK